VFLFTRWGGGVGCLGGGGGGGGMLVCCNMMHCVAVWCSVVQYITGCCSMVQCVVVFHSGYTALLIQNVCIRMLSSTVTQVHVCNDTTPREFFLSNLNLPNVKHIMGTQREKKRQEVLVYSRNHHCHLVGSQGGGWLVIHVTTRGWGVHLL